MAQALGNGLELGEIVGSRRSLRFDPADRYKHLYVCGGTGVGKSKLLEHLIRQDILSWQNHRCGLLLIDPHGSLYDAVVTWLARHNLKRPVVAIDLRRDDKVIGYNPLRRRNGAQAAVIVENLVEAIAHVWGQSDVTPTPQFSQWAFNTLMVLYEKGYTLAETVHLTDRLDNLLRRFVTDGISDPAVAADWSYANMLKPVEFDAQVGSTLRRLRAFVQTPLLRAIFGQSGHSLDLSTALDEGTIVLVSVARDRACVSRRSAEVFATLLLTDLWTAAQQRGKRKGVKPFRVYIDEFQDFVTPSIAANLDQARGYGLHLTMAHQYPRQLLNAGAHGERLYDSVLENASTKAVFRLTNPENLKPLAYSLFMGMIDPDQIKYKLYSTKVLDYSRETFASHTHSTTSGTHSGNTSGRASGRAEAGSIDRNTSDADPARWNEFFTDSDSNNEAYSEQTSDSTGHVEALVPELGQELSQIAHRSMEEQLFIAMSKMFAQEDRHFVTRVVNQRNPVFLYTPHVTEPFVRPERIERYLVRQCDQWPFFRSMQDVQRELDERSALLRAKAMAPEDDGPKTHRRRIR